MSTDARSSVALEQVISNLEICGDYYKKATMVYSVQERHDLCKALIEAEIVTLPKVSEQPKGEAENDQPEDPEESKEVAPTE